VVVVTVSWCLEFECSETDVVQGFVVDTEGLIGVLDQLVNGEGGIVWLDDGVRDLEEVSIESQMEQ
jgi:hypothetical protein